MSARACDFCGRKVAKGEEFVVVGKYPNSWKKAFIVTFFRVGWLPEDFGEFYHKDCYFELLKKKNGRS